LIKNLHICLLKHLKRTFRLQEKLLAPFRLLVKHEISSFSPVFDDQFLPFWNRLNPNRIRIQNTENKPVLTISLLLLAGVFPVLETEAGIHPETPGFHRYSGPPQR
jgi:hypothetical protein